MCQISSGYNFLAEKTYNSAVTVVYKKIKMVTMVVISTRVTLIISISSLNQIKSVQYYTWHNYNKT